MVDLVNYVDPLLGNTPVATNDAVITAVNALGLKIDGLTSTATPAPVYGVGQKYKFCAAGGTVNIYDTVGAVGDRIDKITFFFGDTSPAGAITLKDGATTLFAWTPTALATNQFQTLILNIAAKAAAGFNITLPADVTALAVGNWA